MECFVEYLTARTWFFSILPSLILGRVRIGKRARRCYFFDGSRFTIVVAKATARLVGVPVEKLAFRLVDIRDERGLLVRIRIPCQDLAQVQADAMSDPTFRNFSHNGSTKDRLPAYLAKCIVNRSILDRGSMARALFLVQICAWKTRHKGIKHSDTVLFLERLPWIAAIGRYASRFGVTIVPVAPTFNLRAFLQSFLGPKGIGLLRTLRDALYCWRFFTFTRHQSISQDKITSLQDSTLSAERSTCGTKPSTPRVGVEYYGQFNLNQPECYSDLFFWQQSSLSGSDVSVFFALPQDPLDENKWAALTQHGMTAVVLDPRAAIIPEAPLFIRQPFRKKVLDDRPTAASSPRSPEGKWLGEQVSNYQVLREYWADLFRTMNVKVYVSWYKYDAAHCAIADALQELGGVMAIYQRAYEEFPSAETTIAADIVFGYSQTVASVERLSNSVIPYHVTTGYLGDHRFRMLGGKANTLRSALRQHGAMHILAFFDEGSGDDSRWHSGHEFMRENYAFLLEKVLTERRLGLVLKPKVPSSLRRRLGPVAELLDRAQATGRCYVYKGGALHGSWPPAAAALAADVAIHGHLAAATAGVEAALAGVPTLLMDREGWPVSSLYRLGVGRVVFTDWETLWEACAQHWFSRSGLPGFGDWSVLLNELDPFRDGRAAERMGTYIKWLIDGFKAGLGRESAMATAAERYCEIWGKDKVTSVNSEAWASSGWSNETVALCEVAKSRYLSRQWPADVRLRENRS